VTSLGLVHWACDARPPQTAEYEPGYGLSPLTLCSAPGTGALRNWLRRARSDAPYLRPPKPGYDVFPALQARALPNSLEAETCVDPIGVVALVAVATVVNDEVELRAIVGEHDLEMPSLVFAEAEDR
jgi:hypothetical protein